MLKEQILNILKQVPSTRDSDHYLRLVYYWWHDNKNCKEIDGKVWISSEALKNTDPESIRRTRQKIQEGARKLVKEGQSKYEVLLPSIEAEKYRKEREEQIAEAFGGRVMQGNEF